MSDALARARLTAERKNWRKDHPYGFVAKPNTAADGSTDLFSWTLKIPAKEGSIWAPGVFGATMHFARDFPEKPPTVKFDKIGGKTIFHPNVYTDGGVCLSIINPENSVHGYGRGGTWEPSITVKQIVLALQMFLDEATGRAAGADEAYRLYNHDYPEYVRRVKQQVAKVESSAS
mmetsp:Transcript_20525/g.66639  ORF Transcript_20525/g.66639 Transcript_20525/m.66639 type:complete len:175 (+) Transcript_20525:55-579(+)